jgi:hypothetical protein
MTSSVGLREHALNFAFFGGLMDAPGFLERCLNILLEEEMSEYQLILVDRLLGDDQAQRPLHIVLESETLIHFHDP